MINKLKALLVVTLLGNTLIGCGNKQVIDVHYTFNKAIIEGVGEVSVSSWKDYDNSDSVQVTTKDGITYYTHLNNVILIKNN